MYQRIILFFSFLLLAFVSSAQDEDYVKDNFLRYQDWIYKKSIRTVQLRNTEFELAAPLILFGSGDELQLTFDDLNGGFSNYYYTIIHCDASWNPSDLMQPQYIGGFFEGNILTYTYSTNVLQQYTHYSLTFPNQYMKPLLSGNYLMLVYEDNDKDKPVLSKRFMVYQDLIGITGDVHQAARSDEYYDKQEVDFTISYSTYNITNPNTDMKVVVTQNNRWDNAIYNIQPQFSSLGQFIYDYNDGSNCFDGGNEFRNFDFKTIRVLSPYVRKIYKDSVPFYNVVVTPDEARSFKRYVQFDDLNGEFFIRTVDLKDDGDAYEADYCKVHLFFPYDEPLADGNIYVFGKFCDWRINKENKMVYNMQRKGYECTLFLKQGYYNYEYVYAQDGKSAVDPTLIEGNHWETENDYTIYVYHRKMGTFYDQLIGIKKLNSIRK